MNRTLALSVFATTIAISSLVATYAIAQPPGGGRGPGGNRGPGGDRGPGGRGPGGSPMEMLNQMFDVADADGDGLLSRKEVMAAMENEGGRRPHGGMNRGPGGPPPRHEQEGRHGQRGPRHQHQDQHAGGHRGGHRGGQQGGHGGPGEQGPPPPRPGQILHGHLADSLELTDEQQEQIDALQAEVDKQLAAILTDEQKQIMEEPPRHGPHDAHGPQGEGRPPREGRDQDRRGGRPRRPQ